MQMQTRARIGAHPPTGKRQWQCLGGIGSFSLGHDTGTSTVHVTGSQVKYPQFPSQAHILQVVETIHCKMNSLGRYIDEESTMVPVGLSPSTSTTRLLPGRVQSASIAPRSPRVDRVTPQAPVIHTQASPTSPRRTLPPLQARGGGEVAPVDNGPLSRPCRSPRPNSPAPAPVILPAAPTRSNGRGRSGSKPLLIRTVSASAIPDVVWSSSSTRQRHDMTPGAALSPASPGTVRSRRSLSSVTMDSPSRR